ncbi:LysM peptidoglycan-binding domain-containing protein [Paenibacillus koleovorans]|uniref:LysM peptidoglycan-binding domain-containing protein n=1 Tax=Paenibacillus koleovorans TaxID=121608 RepID=UPI000FD8C26B|nr:glycoside hydrolase family 18 protein [Paenibacillus koleovorans]
MRITSVQPGDSLWAIARRHGVTVDEMIRVNGLEAQANRLVPGQALLVPIREIVHTVGAGETLWSIANRYGVSPDAIAHMNGISNPAMIYPGAQLRIPGTNAAAQPKMTIEVNGYLQLKGTERDRQIVQDTARQLTYFSLFQYVAGADGSLTPPPKPIPTLEAIAKTNAVPMMVVTNFKDGTFSAEIAHAVFTNALAREKLIHNIEQTLMTNQYYSLNVDFEHIYPDDRDLYTDFLKELTGRVHALGKPISTAVAPKTSAEQSGPWYTAHDYGAHGAIVDFVILMTYEWGWSGGPPMAVAPIPQVKRVLDYALTVIPRHKIILSAPLYGYNWTLPYKPGGKFAPTLSPEAAVKLAYDVGAYIQYDPTALAPFFRYYDKEGLEHIVWFEDARSMQAKFNLIKQYNLRGISYWVLGQPFTQNWMLLEANFNVKKVK